MQNVSLDFQDFNLQYIFVPKYHNKKWYHKVHNMPNQFIFPSNALQWRHYEREGISNRRRLYCLINRLFRRRSKKISKLRVTGLCEGNPVDSPHKGPVTRKMFPFDDVIMISERSRLCSWNQLPALIWNGIYMTNCLPLYEMAYIWHLKVLEPGSKGRHRLWCSRWSVCSHVYQSSDEVLSKMSRLVNWLSYWDDNVSFWRWIFHPKEMCFVFVVFCCGEVLTDVISFRACVH